MNILTDWHHPALYESLSILFEDRFGWNLYSPIGMEWNDTRFWRFDNTNIGLQVEDFLVFEDARLVGNHYERQEPDYPDRPRKMVTMDQARHMQWKYVVATVMEHQYTFHMLSKRLGAQFIFQVGNAFQPVDWELDSIVLASADIPLYGPGIIYHQEFDTDLFSYTDLTDQKRIISMMLRLDWSKGYLIWEQAKKKLSDFDMKAFGVDDPFVSPVTEVAKQYKLSGWVWHDKDIGDGFGHAIHNAAASGRPLIGHSSYYTGRLAEPLWVDGITCIDLDAHNLEDAIALIREISSDYDRHTMMCKAIAERFRNIVDYDAEFEQIKQLLG